MVGCDRFVHKRYKIYAYFTLIQPIHSLSKVKVQSALLFSSFVHNSSINELNNTKLSEHIFNEMIN